jgi:hypothetical protein
MKIRSDIKAGGISMQHNEKLAMNKTKSFTVKTGVKAGLNFTKITF